MLDHAIAATWGLPNLMQLVGYYAVQYARDTGAIDGKVLQQAEKASLDDMESKQFAAADAVVLAAPYWDFAFPAMLKIYLELLCAQGVTFNYSPEGIPTGLVNASKAFYGPSRFLVGSTGGQLREA